MPGYDDPRFLQQKIETLERDLKDLKAVSLPFLVHQRGALPGSMRAISIGDFGMKSSMWVNLVGSVAGNAPYQAVADASGTVRVELGNLAANGISPQQFGLRANDVNGAPIFDSLGLINVMGRVGGVNVGGGFNTSSTTFVDITSCSFTATLARQSRILTFYQAAANLNFDTFGDIVLNIDSVVQGADLFYPQINTNGVLTCTLWDVIILAAGSHTWKLRARVGNASGNILLSTASIEAFQLGVV